MNIREIFTAALQRPNAVERAAFLDGACGADAGLHARIEALLAEHDQLGSFLESPAAGEPVTALPDDQGRHEAAGTQIGPYRLLRQIGEGGMGVVYLAQQTEPVKRHVALKIIKPGMDTRQVIARFEAERQALALMDHPHIAQVFDAGATDSGQPYFVMELVSGIPITRYCDEKQLTLRERLELFIPVCQAIQHAHQKGIIHRDVKPSNVLVAEYDGQSIPKVIDFGVAKATSQPSSERSMLTGSGQVVGTVEYMSPEQAKVNQWDIDTRSDVYSLGVLLYELLTGLTPFDKERLFSAAWDEVLRIIREDDPPTPSTRLNSSDALPSIAAARHIEPRVLTGLLRRELDWVVMKAMEKDRDRRYTSPAAFSEDIRRYLDNEPVLARPPSAAYRLRKLAVRHALLLSALGAVMLTLSVGVAVSTWLAFRATGAERLAARRSELAERRYQLAREAIDTYLHEVTEDEQLKSAPLHQLREKLLSSAIPFYERLANERSENDGERAARADAWLRLGRVHDELGDYAAAISDFDQARISFQKLAALEPESVEYQTGLAGSHENQAWILRKTGQTDAARDALDSAMQLWGRLAAAAPLTPRHRLDQARALNSLGNLLMDLGEEDAAQRAYEQVRETCETLAFELPRDPRRLVALGNSCHNLGLLARRLGRRQQARACFDRAIECYQQLTHDALSSPQYQRSLAQVHRSKANLLNEMNDAADARAAYLASLETDERLAKTFTAVPDYRLALAGSHNDFGLFLQSCDDLELASEHFQLAIREYEQLGNELRARVELARAMHNLAWVRRRQEEYGEAQERFTKAIELRTRLAAEHADVPARQDELAQSWNDLGVTLADQQQWEAARQAYDQAVAARRQLIAASGNPDYRVSLGGTCCNLGNLESEQQQLEDSLPWFQQAEELLRGVLAEVDVDSTATLYLRNTYWSRAEALEKLGRYAEAADDWTRAMELTPDEKRQSFRRSLALALPRAGRHEEAMAVAEALASGGQASPVDLMTAAITVSLGAAVAAADPVRRERLGQRAVELIELARAGGLFGSAADVRRLKTHPGLEALRDRPDFQQLLERVEQELGSPSPQPSSG